MKEKEFLAVLAALIMIEDAVAVNTGATKYGEDCTADHYTWEEAVELARERIQIIRLRR